MIARLDRIPVKVIDGITYDDVLEVAYATGADLEQMGKGCHYDYQVQQWVDGHDHAHIAGDDSPLMFCGADIVTCCG